MAKNVKSKRMVRNSSQVKVELPWENSVVIFPPKSTIVVPEGLLIPKNLGLTEL